MTAKPQWRKSSYSNDQGNCVEVAMLTHGMIGVRDTKDNGTGAILTFTRPEWEAFLEGVRDGEFNPS
ncbi:DUF397 domain-containing protein [Nocardia sp. NPDC052566]|uniref:DUF397 domain-containing protein n=1 Tax=Nocardia sp. NPDC052566 TaxID=3364330 RepID=UPI0037CB2357